MISDNSADQPEFGQTLPQRADFHINRSNGMAHDEPEPDHDKIV